MLTSHYTVQHTEASLHWTCLFRLAAAIKLCVLLLVQSGATFAPAALLVWETISAALIEEESVDRAPPRWQQVYRLLSPVVPGYIGVQHQHRLHMAESENPQCSAVQCLKLYSQPTAAIFFEQSNAVTVYTPALLTIFHYGMSICGGHVQHLTEQPSFHVERVSRLVSVYQPMWPLKTFQTRDQSHFSQTGPTLWSHCHQILYKKLSVSDNENHSLTIPWLFQKPVWILFYFLFFVKCWQLLDRLSCNL